MPNEIYCDFIVVIIIIINKHRTMKIYWIVLWESM